MAFVDRVRVVDLTEASGIYGTKLLADMGADVIRVEPPGGDPLRSHPPFLSGRPGPGRSLWYAYMATSRRSVVLDLDSAEGRRLLGRLIDTADVVAFSGPADRFDDLGLGGLRSTRPGLVVSAVSPFGLTGPFRSWEGNDFIGWATGGLSFSTGDPDRPPLSPAPVAELAHVLSGYLATLGTLAALRGRSRHGVGDLVDVSVQQGVLTASGESGVAAFLDDLVPRVRGGSRRAAIVPVGHYPTKDGAASLIGLMPAHWEALAAWIAEETANEGVLDPDLAGPGFVRAEEGKREVVDLFVEDLTRRYTKQELFEEGQRRGVTITPVNDPASTAADPQLAFRGFWRNVPVDGTDVRVPGSPARFGSLAWNARPAPDVGEHTAEVLAELA